MNSATQAVTTAASATAGAVIGALTDKVMNYLFSFAPALPPPARALVQTGVGVLILQYGLGQVSSWVNAEDPSTLGGAFLPVFFVASQPTLLNNIALTIRPRGARAGLSPSGATRAVAADPILAVDKASGALTKPPPAPITST